MVTGERENRTFFFLIADNMSPLALCAWMIPFFFLCFRSAFGPPREWTGLVGTGPVALQLFRGAFMLGPPGSAP